MDTLALNSSSPAGAPGGDPEPQQSDLLGLFTETAADADADAEDDTDDQFNWLNIDEESIVLEPQPGVAVYRNKRRHIVLRGEAVGYDADDSFIYIATETALKALIGSLQRELKAGGLRP